MPPNQRLENRLLRSLPLDSALQALEPIALHSGQVLCEQNARISHIYFPCSGMISLIAQLQDGASIEVGCVGREGMVGFEALLASSKANRRMVMQIPGTSYKVPVARLRSLFSENQGARDAMLTYVCRVYRETTQNVACNLSHSLDERLARWLLLTSDRAASGELALTHEFVSQMLGVRRTSVSLALGVLQRLGFIRYKRGRISITDRPGLEGMACECYAAVR